MSKRTSTTKQPASLQEQLQGVGLSAPVEDPMASLLEATQKNNPKSMGQWIAKALAAGVLSPGDLTGGNVAKSAEIPVMPRHSAPAISMHDIRIKAIHMKTQGTVGPSNALQAWEICQRLGCVPTVLEEMAQTNNGTSRLLHSVLAANQAFMQGIPRGVKVELEELAYAKSPPAGVYRIGFRIDVVPHFPGLAIEQCEDPRALAGDDEAVNLLRQRLSPTGYVEMCECSYYDDERNNGYSVGVLSVALTPEIMEDFVASRRPLADVEAFFIQAKGSAKDMQTSISGGMPFDVTREHVPVSGRALTAACSGLNDLSVRILIDLGANPSRDKAELLSPLGAILSSSVGRDALDPSPSSIVVPAQHQANRFSAWRCLDLLVAAGADLNEEAVGYKKLNPLALACELENIELITYLLKHGADPCVKNGDGNDLFEFAKKRNRVEVLALLDGWRAGQAVDEAIEKSRTLGNGAQGSVRP